MSKINKCDHGRHISERCDRCEKPWMDDNTTKPRLKHQRPAHLDDSECKDINQHLEEMKTKQSQYFYGKQNDEKSS